MNSTLINRSGLEINNDRIKIYDGHWMEANQALPQKLDFLPPLTLLENPHAIFEDALIQAPLDNSTSYSLEFEGRRYLLPYKKEILDYFTPEEIVSNTSIHRGTPNHVTVDLVFPLVNNRQIKATHNYREGDEIVDLGKYPVANLAFWPNFICQESDNGGGWNHYFYYKYDQGTKQLDFEPLEGSRIQRSLQDRIWFETDKPVTGFVGSVDGRQGLLLVKYEPIRPPTRDWKVAMDLGSTHTRAFYLEVEKQGDQWVGVSGSSIRPIKIPSQVKEITACQPGDLLENFFVLNKGVPAPPTEEFMSQLVMPQPNNEDHPDWLPREGLIYQQSLLEHIPANVMKYNFKWNSNTTDYALRAYMRCLLTLIKGEALREGARVVSVSHAYPSVFTPGLVQKHSNEWIGLGNYANLQTELPLKESEAVGRYLQFEQGAAVAVNTIALDVGGSTTDIAIWASNRLGLQESVKMAAGVAGRYVQTEQGPFKHELVRILAAQPFKKNINLNDFKNRDSGFSLMFNAVLHDAEAAGQLEQLITSIKNSAEGRKLIAHIMFIYGGLLYYAGLLGRRMQMEQSNYYVYFCGKGGRLITWINNYEQFVRDMFAAGRQGTKPTQSVTQGIRVILSAMPKQEVGRGLLAESSLRAASDMDHGGLVNLEPPTVTVGEYGYNGLDWKGELKRDVLMGLPHQVPAFADMKELNNFVQTFVTSASTKDAAALLKLSAQEPVDFRSNLTERLFGLARGRVIYDLLHYPNDALLEPLFITEVKVLLETITNNPQIFLS